MNIKLVLSPLLKFWWLIALAAVLAMASSYYVTSQQPPLYQSRATLMVGRSLLQANPTSSDLWMGQQLANYYADIGKRSEVQNAVKETLGISWLPQYNLRPLPNSMLMEIVVVDTNPARAQAVANELANQLILISPTSNENQGVERQAFIEEQVAYLETKIRETLSDIEAAEKELGDLNSAREISDARTRINALQTKLSQLQANYASLISNTEQGAVNQLRVIERASLPTRPVGSNAMIIILLSAAVASVIAAAAAYLIEFLDDTFKSTEEVTEMLKLPVLATVPFVNNKQLNPARKPGKNKPPNGKHGSTGLNEEIGDIFTYIASNPRSLLAEEFRLLRTNIDFAGVDQPLKRIFITSTDPNEGKTSVAINLAIVMAQGGKRVALLDADLRNPSISKYLRIGNDQGLSDLLRYNIRPESVVTEWKTCVDCSLAVISTGITPPNPVDLITSRKMEQVLQQIDKMAEVLIIDGPPMPFSDSIALSKKVDGVVVVVSHAQTRRTMVRKVIKNLQQVDARILGVVYNKAPYRSISYYYKSYTQDHEVASEPEPKTLN